MSDFEEAKTALQDRVKESVKDLMEFMDCDGFTMKCDEHRIEVRRIPETE